MNDKIKKNISKSFKCSFPYQAFERFAFFDMIGNEIKFNIQISEHPYSIKPEGKDYSTMKFFETTTTIPDLISKIQEGYSYAICRKLSKFKETSLMSFDIDGETIPMKDYLEKVFLKPTFSYTTCNDNDEEYAFKKYGNKDQKYRFRFVYIFNEPIDGLDNYKTVYQFFSNQLPKKLNDNCSMTPNQLMNGNGTGNIEIINFNKTYDFPLELKTEKTEQKTEKSARHKPNITLSTIGLVGCTFLEQEIKDSFLKFDDYNDFLDWFRKEYGDVAFPSETIYEQSEDERIMVCDEYYELPRKKFWDKELKQKVYGKWNDNENRHTKIYTAGIIERHLKANITYNEMLYFIVKELMTYYDICNENDGKKTIKFTKKTILDLVECIMKADLNIKLKEIKHSNYKISDKFCKENHISKQKVNGQLNAERERQKKEQRFFEIGYFYDPSLTLYGKKITYNQWIEILKENGIEVSLRTFKTYLETKGFVKKRETEQKTEKSARHKPNITLSTIGLVGCTFLEQEEFVKKRETEQKTEKSARHKPNITLSTIGLVGCTFLEQEEFDETFVDANRKFRGICNRLNYGNTDFSEEIEWFKKQ